MGFKDLRAWIDKLESEGELKRIKAEVDWDEELGGILRRLWEVYSAQEMGKLGPALLFENIKGYKEGRCTRLFTNGLGLQRISLMLGLPKDTPPPEAIKVLHERIREPIKPVRVKTGPVKENIVKGKDINLFDFPVPKWNSLDGGRYINTYAGEVTRDPDTGQLNVGMYRGMIQAKDRIGVYLIPSKDWGLHYIRCQEMGKPMPVAVVYGWDPALLTVAVAGFSTECEYDMAGAIRQEPVELVKCQTSDIEVPASAEIVVEGFISPDPATYEMEGPFGEWTGYYGEAMKRPVIQVSCITHRNDPIFRGGVTGTVKSAAHEGIIFSAINTGVYKNILRAAGVPGVIDIVRRKMYLAVQIHKTYQGQARQVAAALWGSKSVTEQTRVIIVVEEDVDIHDPDALLCAIGTHADYPDDIIIYPLEVSAALNPVHSLEEKDDLKYGAGLGSNLLIDATINWKTHPKRPEWGNRRYPPTTFGSRPEIEELVRRRWTEYGL